MSQRGKSSSDGGRALRRRGSRGDDALRNWLIRRSRVNKPALGNLVILAGTRHDSTQRLLRIVKDHTDCVTATRSQTADAVSKVDTVDTPGSLDGTVADREDHTVATAKRHDLGSGLHPWPLLG